MIKVRKKYGYSFNGTSSKEEQLFLKSNKNYILNQGRPNNSLREIDFKGRHLNQEWYF